MKQDLSQDERLDLIVSMIGEAKRNVAKGGSFYFLLWGWVVMLANLGHYLIMKFDWMDAPYVVWLGTLPAAAISMWYGFKQRKRAVVKSHIDNLYSYIWLAVFVATAITLFFVGNLTSNLNGIIIVFAGLGTFLSGCVLRFKPSILGGVGLWLSAIVIFNVALQEQYLFAALGIFIGYLVPGYMLRKAENESV